VILTWLIAIRRPQASNDRLGHAVKSSTYETPTELLVSRNGAQVLYKPCLSTRIIPVLVGLPRLVDAIRSDFPPRMRDLTPDHYKSLAVCKSSSSFSRSLSNCVFNSFPSNIAQNACRISVSSSPSAYAFRISTHISTAALHFLAVA
jgi:hypothetical protein